MLKLTKLQNSTLAEFWLLILLTCGFVVVLGIPTLLGIHNPKWITTSYRIVIFIFSVYVLFKNFSWEKLRNTASISFIFFWLFYFIKLQYSFKTDYYLEGFRSTLLEKSIRIFVIILIPGIALLFINYSKINLEKLGKIIFRVLLIMLSINLVYGLATYSGVYDIPYIFHIYYIWAGHLGTTLAVFSLFYLMFTQPVSKDKVIYAFGLILGIISIIIFRARSPFLAFVIVSLYFIIIKKDVKLLLLFAGIFILSIISIYWIGGKNPEGIQFANRMYRWIFEGDTSLREPLFERGMNIFKSNPLFGGRVYYEDGFYPHNLILELLMATGLIGLVFYVLQFTPVFRTLKLYLNPKHNLNYILFFSFFFQYLILKMTSADMLNSYFIHFSCIIIGISSSYSRSDRV